MAKAITILFLLLFTTTLMLDECVKYTDREALTYELLDLEEENESEKDESIEEYNLDDFIHHRSDLGFFNPTLKQKHSFFSLLMMKTLGEIILPPPEFT